MKTSHKLLISLACVVMLSGCARNTPILTPQTTIMTHNSLPDVKKAILEAGQKRKWVMTEVSPGVINGYLKNRDHDAQIRINYTNKNYSINYVTSHNLKAHNGKIHRNYNRWVNNLDKDIQLNLALLSNH
ncbi:hypothetical protein [Xenorhabdus szentirmaii]|uniref:Lipoprotein n=1 Tax=Xenorhabdus szentirmaii DSM 16338 TaxID=1427518 RepID=W1IXJ7_9GAMM|nr:MULTISPECIES: hypothetical protein [Xenorhabdus]MBD2779293.1 hypothetical protein [Xenorhabdus sp. 38]MBD2791245.1 hypothetical protein [Xenorhabdus sp. CUL]MBD2804720.1 hypothetical protein [Xenorhabdus sp. ZM]MBD2821940.1 hypothetical protein [Xenorhabdus sp. 42]MBD2824005.1 hypothetical protein [Xenorhabdus sp. 5]